MRLFALRCAGKNVNCNVVVPGVTVTDAWGKLAATRGMEKVPAPRTTIHARLPSHLSAGLSPPTPFFKPHCEPYPSCT